MRERKLANRAVVRKKGDIVVMLIRGASSLARIDQTSLGVQGLFQFGQKGLEERLTGFFLAG